MISKKAIIWSSNNDITSKQLKELPDWLFEYDEWTQIEERCAESSIEGTDFSSEHYHYKLSRLSSAPPVMYRKGDFSLLNKPLLALVWPRLPSVFLSSVTKDLCGLLWNYSIATVSWGAEWIDYLAHQCSIEQKVPTIVVLWWWFRRYRKRREWQFFEKVVAAGWLILSEWKLDQSPTSYTFPQRNRIIAGISDIVFLPGAAKWSWSLITVDFALQFGILVVTVPGSYYEPTCAGTNEYLCKKKIHGTTDLHHFLEQFFGQYAVGSKNYSWAILELSEQEKSVLGCLDSSLTITVLVERLGWELPIVLEVLLYLEVKNLVYSPEPWWYARK